MGGAKVLGGAGVAVVSARLLPETGQAKSPINGAGEASMETENVGRDRRATRQQRPARWAVGVLLVALALTGIATSAAAAGAGSVADVSLSASSTGGAATATIWNLRFVTPDALPAGASVTVSAPAGTSFPAGGASVYDLTQNASIPVSAQSLSGGGDAVSLTLGSGAPARDLLALHFAGVTNPPGGTPLSSVTVATTVDSQPAGAGGGAFGSPQSVSELGFSPSSPAGGATGVTWSLHFTTSPQGGLPGTGDGKITLAAPAGTVFSGAAPTIYDLDTGMTIGVASPALSNSSATESVPVTSRVAGGEKLVLIQPDVTNPAAGTPFAGVSLSTSADSVPASPASGGFVAAGSVSNVAFGASNAGAGATNTTWNVRFTLSASGGLSDHGTITIGGPSGTSFAGGSPNVWDLTTGIQLPAVAAHSGSSETITAGGELAGGDTLEVSQSGVTNPPGGISPGQVSVSTSSDPSPVAASALGAATSSISNVAVAENTLAGGASAAVWSYSFVTSTTGALSGGNTVTINAPSGTTLFGGCGTRVIDETTGAFDDLCGGRVTVSNGGATATITLDGGMSIGAGDSVVVLLAQTGNPAASGYAAADFSVSTSADTTAVSPASGQTFTRAAAPGAPIVNVSTPAGGASGASWSYTFAASPSGELSSTGGHAPGASIVVNAPSGTTLPGPCGTYVIDESTGVQDNLCGGPVTQSNNGATDTIHLDGGILIGAGDTVAVLFAGVTNPPAGTEPASGYSASTSSDTASASPSAGQTFSNPGAPVGVILSDTSGGSGRDWTVAFSPSQTGLLSGSSHSTITIAAPARTQLPPACGITVVDDTAASTDSLCGGDVVQSNGSATDAIHLDGGFIAAPGDDIRVQLNGVTEAGNPDATTLATSSDPTPSTVSGAAPPVTAITSGVTGQTTNPSPTFTFTSNQANSTFTCRLDGPGSQSGSPQACNSGSQSYSNLAPGAYTFTVTATGPQGLSDPTPPSAQFTEAAPPSGGGGGGGGGSSGTPQVSISPASLNFGTLTVGATSPAQTVTVTDRGTGPLQPVVALTGAGASQFRTGADSCSGVTINPGGTCSVDVEFVPSSPGGAGAALQISDASTGAFAASALTGIGAPFAQVSGVVQYNASPVPGATVQTCTIGARTCQTVSTNSAGAFTLAEPMPSTARYDLIAQPPGTIRAGSASISPLTVTPNGLSGLIISLPAPPSIVPGMTVVSPSHGIQTSSTPNPTVYWDEPTTVQLARSLFPAGGAVDVTELVITGTNAKTGAPASKVVDVGGSVAGNPVGETIGNQPLSVTIPPLDPIHGEVRLHVEYQRFPPGSFQPTGVSATQILDEIWPPAAPGTQFSNPFAPTDPLPAYFVNVGDPGGVFLGSATITGTDAASFKIVPLSSYGVPAGTRDCSASTLSLTQWDRIGSNPQGASACGIAVQFTPVAPANRVIYRATLEVRARGGNQNGLDEVSLVGCNSSISQVAAASDGYDPCSSPSAPDEDTEGEIASTGGGVGATSGSGGAGGSSSSGGSAGGAGGSAGQSQSGQDGELDLPMGYVDPSGTVYARVGHGSLVPLAGATVTLEVKTRRGFRAVANGSAVMSPSNRRDPDRTDSMGTFGWDVLPGIYRVAVTHPGCSAARSKRALSRVVVVPPPALHMRIVVICPGLKLASTQTSLRVHKRREHELLLTAHVRGRHPYGVVQFLHAGHLLGTAPVNPRTGIATLTIRVRPTRGFVARYLGSGLDAASSGHA
jgi:hypothetical protein